MIHFNLISCSLPNPILFFYAGIFYIGLDSSNSIKNTLKNINNIIYLKYTLYHIHIFFLILHNMSYIYHAYNIY